jgi:hypothetical protein
MRVEFAQVSGSSSVRDHDLLRLVQRRVAGIVFRRSEALEQAVGVRPEYQCLIFVAVGLGPLLDQLGTLLAPQ